MVLQLSLLAIAALTVYHDPTRVSIGYDIQPYGFPCYIGGSVLLFVGVSICSVAIESSTIEFTWKRSSRPSVTETETREQRTEATPEPTPGIRNGFQEVSLGTTGDCLDVLADDLTSAAGNKRLRLIWLQQH